jgi:hypothetical protein
VIFSAGADGVYGLACGRLEPDGSGYKYRSLTSASTAEDVNPFSFPTGIPMIWTSEGHTTLNHYDNIHNHRSGNSF